MSEVDHERRPQWEHLGQPEVWRCGLDAQPVGLRLCWFASGGQSPIEDAAGAGELELLSEHERELGLLVAEADAVGEATGHGFAWQPAGIAVLDAQRDRKPQRELDQTDVMQGVTLLNALACRTAFDRREPAAEQRVRGP